jgi:general stress protein 26
MAMAEEALDTFWSLIESVDVCMMTTRDANALRARPMVPKIDKATREFRFLTRMSTHKVDELAAHPDANLAFCDPGSGAFVSVSGQAYLTQDRRLIDRLWSPDAEAYFSCGKDDRDIAVIRVVPSKAEYWDAQSTLRQAWNIFKAEVAAAEPELDRSRRAALG